MPITSKGRELNLVILNSYYRLKSKALSKLEFKPIDDVIHMDQVKQWIQEIEEMEIKKIEDVKEDE